MLLYQTDFTLLIFTQKTKIKYIFNVVIYTQTFLQFVRNRVNFY